MDSGLSRCRLQIGLKETSRRRMGSAQQYPSIKPTPKPPGVARQLVTLFLRRQEKVTKKKATPVCRRFAVPCVARSVRRLRNSRCALRQSSPTSPDRPVLLGGAQGKMKCGFVRAARTFFGYAKSNSNTSASLPAARLTRSSPTYISASPALNSLPLACRLPRATCR